MVSRIAADPPPADDEGASNLPGLIHAAYYAEVMRSLRRWRSAARRRLLP